MQNTEKYANICEINSWYLITDTMKQISIEKQLKKKYTKP